MAAVLAATPSICTARQVSGAPTTPILVDADMTVGAGATVSAAVGEAVARAEDVLVPPRLFAERGATRRTANILYRVLKFTLFDLPQEQWIVVANHEVFGHGARLRERFGGPIRYRVDAPVPYGSGGGSTSFGFDREPTTTELLALSAAGMEADAVAASTIAHVAFSAGRLRARDAMRYLGFELDTLGYVSSTDDDFEDPGHDVADFLETYNALGVPAGASALTARQLRREVLVSLANPMVAYAAFAIGRYLATGVNEVPVLTLSIAGMRYLPLVRYRLTPYGTEWSVMNELAPGHPRSRRFGSVQIEVRVGRSPAATPWGLGIHRRDLARWREWRVDAGFDMWRQPRLHTTVAAGGESLRTGAELRVRIERPLARVWFSAAPATVIVDGAVKSSGFVAGEPLRGGALLRAGIGLPFDR